MANFPGGQGATPDVIVDVETRSRGVSVPGGIRTAAILGEGARFERLVVSALGSGNDGLNDTYTGTNGRDGRHFQISTFPMVSNRTIVYKNGIALSGLEQNFDEDTGSFSSRYEYRVDITDGQLELQGAALVDQGGSFYSANILNVGNGTISSLSLIDENAPTETWTIKCVSVRRDGYGDPVDGYAKFIATGSVSGIILDGYGNVITWQSNGVIVNNTILQFAINEGSTPFVEGDKFVIKVKGGALVRGDSLTVVYIAEQDLNDPEFFDNIDNLAAKHGLASVTNTLSLGAQLAFANRPPGVWACQAAPPIPRRVSYTVEASASGAALADDLQFNLPLGVIPDSNSNINFFITDGASDIESQIIPNKVDFYDATYTASPGAFHFGTLEYSYTVILVDAVVAEADDGVVTVISPTSATLSSNSVLFTLGDIGKTVKILTPDVNAGTQTIVSVTSGVATLSGTFVSSSTNAEFELLDDTLQTAQVLITDDLALTAGNSLRVTVIDQKDADFFDANWTAAYEAIEAIECDMVVPLPMQTISQIFQAGRAHVETMSQNRNKKERVLFIGAIQGLTAQNVLGTEDAAVEDIGILEGIQGDEVSEVLADNIEDLANYSVVNAFGNTFRVVYFYPDEIVVPIAGSNTKIDGFYMAAAAAGFLSGILNVAIPLTRKTLAGFTILRDRLLRPLIIDNLAAAGITVVQPVQGGGRVVWGKTTTQSGFPEEEEISIIFIRDQIAKGLRGAFAGFIGNPEDETLEGTLKGRAEAAMRGFKGRKLITQFRDVKVTRDTTDPRQWNISVAAQPVYPVNWIYIKVEVGTL